MSYQVIARKYRPQRFADVVGQEHVTQTLANAIAQNRIAHAYLFCGPRGTGKTTIARIFAKCLRCEKGPTPEPCNECSECRAITAGNSMDMLEFDAASNTQVDKIREIIVEQVKYTPATGKVKLYLVDEVHMLSTSSFNALLKTLEEPPPHVKFLFATTDPEKLPATILSRCQRFDLRRIPTPLIVKQLDEIARAENIRIGPTALHAIARGAEGCLRDAESTLDQLISFCGETIEESDVLSMFGLAARSQIVALARAVIDGQIEPALRELDQLARSGKELGRLVSDLLNHFRNLLIYQVSNGDLSLLEVTEEEAVNLAQQAPLIPPDALSRIMEVFTDCEWRLREAISKKILVEVALLQAVQARNAVSVDALLNQLQQLRDQPAGAAAPTPAPAAAPRPAARSAPEPSARLAETASAAGTAAPAAAPAADLEGLWSQIAEGVGRASPFARTYLLEAHPVGFERNVLTIGFDPEFQDHVGLVNNAKNIALIQTKLHELGHANAQVKFIVAEAPAGHRAGAPVAPAATEAPAGAPPARAETPPAPEPPKAPAASADDFKNDPLIKQALEIFKGRIVEVRS